MTASTETTSSRLERLLHSRPAWQHRLQRLMTGRATPVDLLWARPWEAMTDPDDPNSKADEWQQQVLRDWTRNWLICASRQSGKSTTVAAKAYLEAVCDGRFVLIISRSEHQAFEFFEKVMQCYKWRPLVATAREPTMSELRLVNGGRILALPHSENTVVGYSSVDLLVLDEAARISDAVYRAVKPMLAVKRGRSISLSTPYGKRGFFWNQWRSCNEVEQHNDLLRQAGNDGATLRLPYARCRVPWQQCPRITPQFVEDERLENGDLHVQQEYECVFLDSVLDCAFDVARMEDLLSNLQSNAVL